MPDVLQETAVLIVEDNADVRELLEVIVGLQGAQIRSTASASETIDVLSDWVPHVMLIDITLPDIDGYKLLKLLRGRADLAKIPAVAVSRHAFDTYNVRAFEAGFTAYISQPLDPPALVELIASLVSASENGPVSSTIGATAARDR